MLDAEGLLLTIACLASEMTCHDSRGLSASDPSGCSTMVSATSGAGRRSVYWTVWSAEKVALVCGGDSASVIPSWCATLTVSAATIAAGVSDWSGALTVLSSVVSGVVGSVSVSVTCDLSLNSVLGASSATIWLPWVGDPADASG